MTRVLDGDELALLIAAPSHDGGEWKVVTVLSKSTAISPIGRLVRSWNRGTRAIANRIRYRTPAPERERATRPAALGDLSTPRRRSGPHRRR